MAVPIGSIPPDFGSDRLLIGCHGSWRCLAAGRIMGMAAQHATEVQAFRRVKFGSSRSQFAPHFPIPTGARVPQRQGCPTMAAVAINS